MASNLSSLGFVFSDGEEFAAAMVKLAADADEFMATPRGEYAIWRSRTGAEIWFHVRPADAGEEPEIIGLTPFFEGKSEVPLQVTEAVRRPGDSDMEGAYTAWVGVEPDGEGAFPLVFDAVDFAAHGEEGCGQVQARITGFARELSAYASAEAFQAAQHREPRLADQCFIPMGLFSVAMSEGSEEGPPSSAALLSGRVAEHARLVNEQTGQAFHWLLVECLELTLDVVADPEVVTGEIAVGGTVEVACLLIGRILE